jgi:hypothetical protein
MKRKAIEQLDEFGGANVYISPLDVGRPPPVIQSRQTFAYHVKNLVGHFASLGENAPKKNFYIAVGSVSLLFFVLCGMSSENISGPLLHQPLCPPGPDIFSESIPHTSS